VEFLRVLEGLVPGLDTGRWRRSLVAWQAGDRKLVWASDGRHRLYDLAADRGEDHDLGPGGPGAPDSAARVEAWLARPAARPPLAAPAARQ
jgi:hypothetical protein